MTDVQQTPKNFLENFPRYHPADHLVAILMRATDITRRVDKERRYVEIDARFPTVLEKSVIYEIEEGIRQAYTLNRVMLLPKYPPEQFTNAYVPQILTETERVGIVARGFFSQYTHRLADGVLHIDIPIPLGGIALMEDAKTPAVMEGIIRSEFGLSVKVEIHHVESTSGGGFSERRARELAELDRQLIEAEKNYAPHTSAEGGYGGSGGGAPAAEDAQPSLPRAPSIFFDEDGSLHTDGTICSIGHYRFDIGEPNYVWGDAFAITPTAICEIDKQVKNLTIIGEVSCFTKDEARGGEKFNITFGLFDGHSSIDVKKTGVEPSVAKELAGILANGKAVALHGYTKRDVRRGIMDEDLSFYFNSIAEIKKLDRKDTAPEKRVELHLHTQMSTMDALIPPEAAIKQAQKWGHPAVAITDHGNVQAYQMAMLQAEKCGMNVIYGMEAYFVNDTAGCVVGNYMGDFEDEMIVFDIETTGLSVVNCKITEIGAVKIAGGRVLDTFNTFVNPEVPIPEEITKLTSITDEMVADAPKIEEALRAFLDFAGNRLLIAHNANFDTSFIRAAARQCGYEFKNPYMDTVVLSRFLNTDLKSHKLDVVAKYYGLGDFNHHRACDDAEMLAHIYFAMVEKMHKFDLRNFGTLAKEMSANADPLKLKTYHQIILVKNKTGLKNLYQLISDSYLKYYKRFPRIPKTKLQQHREGLIIGSACEAGEVFRAVLEERPEAEIEELVNFYDYLEIQPICNNRFLIAEGSVSDDEGLRELNRKIVALGEKYNKPVVATCDAHFMNKDDEICRKILMAGMHFKDYDKDVGIYFRTTDEMLEEFAYLGEEKAYEVVVTNTRAIADSIDYENIRPFPKGTFTPHMDGAEEDLQRICYEHAEGQYGKPLPELVKNRLDKELTSIIKNGFAVLYMIAQKLVWYSESQGYLVGSRGSVGSSFVASCAGISEVNPLPPHYYCPNCQHSEFFLDGTVGSGFDLPDANCPKCGTKYCADGHDIPFETFLGFYGDKSPDIDLNFSGEVQGKVHKYTEELFGAENVFRAGTIGTLADKTAYGFIAKYMEEKQSSLCRAEMNRLVSCCVGVKRTTGQHPGGIVVVPREYQIYDFCPVQHPADDPNSDIVTTHFTFEYLHDTLLKLDELGHDMPTKYKWLERYSGTSVMDVPMNSPEVYQLFESVAPLGIKSEDILGCEVGTWGLPEMGTRFLQQVLVDAKPKNFADLLQISGLTHGTDVWLGNAQDLIKEGVCDISKVIGCRDGIMLDLIRYGMENAVAFKIMESVRKGKGLTPEWEADMRAHNVPDWYIGSCKKIKYMFPKAHAAAYVMSAIRLGWYKIHLPIVFYSAMFTVAPKGFDAEVVMGGIKRVKEYIQDIEKRGKEASAQEQSSIPTFQLVMECMARGIRFLPVHLEKSSAHGYVPENGAIRLPFSSLPGLGDNAADNIENARREEPFFSIEDLSTRAKLSKSVIEILRRNGALDGVNETDQLSFF